MKKSLLFINGHLNAGGVERSLVDVLRHINTERYDVTLMLTEGYGDYLPEIPRSVNVKMYPLNDAGGPFFSTIIRLIQRRQWPLLGYRFLFLISKFAGDQIWAYSRWLFSEINKEYDAVIGYRSNVATLFAAYTFRAKKRLAWWHNGDLNVTGKAQQALERWYEKLDYVVAVSYCTADLVRTNFPIIKDRVVVIPNMLCSEEIKLKSQNTQVIFDSNLLNIVSVGRMSPEKNMMFCVEVAKELKTCGTKFRWYLIGDGIEMPSIKSEIDSSDLKSQFILTGRLPNPYPYMKEADILFHPSLIESQGLTVLEAMALGTPVIAVASSGVKEFVQNRGNGLLITNDANEGVKMINFIRENSKACKSIERKAISTTTEYSPKVIINRIESLI